MINEWTIATLKEHTDERFRSQEGAVAAALAAQKEALSAALAATNQAISKADANTEARFKSVNEFREQLREQAGAFARKDEIKNLTDRLASVELRLTDTTSRQAGKGSITGPLWALGGGLLISLLVGIILLVLETMKRAP